MTDAEMLFQLNMAYSRPSNRLEKNYI